jgi:uncharacterized protein YehS (DUF1456 family)
MTINFTLQSLQRTFQWSEAEIIEIFANADHAVTATQVSRWLKKEDDDHFLLLKDIELGIFLNGLIIKTRGKKEGPSPAPEPKITNNTILKKIKIALDLQGKEVQDILGLAGVAIIDYELSAFFRKHDHKNYRKCPDRMLRSFLKGLQIKFSA